MFDEAVQALARGEVVAVPTEAVYGLSADPRNEAAIKRLLEMKKRNPEKGLILVASDLSQLEPYVGEIPEHVLSTWPGPNTWLLPVKSSVSELLPGKFETLAVRLTAHPVLAQLCREFKSALVSTSANFEGLPPARTEHEVRDYFGKDLIIVPGELGGLDKPTVIRDARTGAVIRN